MLIRSLLVAALTLVVTVGVAYVYRLDLLLWAAPKIAAWRNPVAPNMEVEWPAGPQSPSLPTQDRPPNIVIILADDMGFNDLSFFGGGAANGSVKTPHIDSIAKDGVAFTNGYAANAVCAPSRASIMTGRYATRFGFEFTPFFRIGAHIAELMYDPASSALPPIVHHDRLESLPPMRQLGMPAEEITIAEVLADAGYRSAHIGKWHLGAEPGMRPEDQGFDASLYMAGVAYLPEHSPEVVNAKLDFSSIDRMVWASMRYAAQFNGGHTFAPKGYLTDYYTGEAIRFIKRNRNHPFLLYLAHWGIHNPLQAKKSDYDDLQHIQNHTLRVYAAMIRALDRSVGDVLRTLEEQGLTDNTLVIFSSDNGGAHYLGLPGINTPYRGWKLTHFEGGIHVPIFMKWPQRIPAGVTFNAPVSHMDFFPTIAAAAGAAQPDDRTIDGVDLLPFVQGERVGDPHQTLFWRQGHVQTVLHDGWKLITAGRPDVRWLFALQGDPHERKNLAQRHPDKVAELEALLQTHNAGQSAPLWPSVLEIPVLIDKTEKEPHKPGDAHSYWPN